ncbi:OsmC family protein [Luteibaculum oceani]|uniref:OsmC family protein n=1 Tax=Luteibaculum oceani TaxID=1294296 RepID=A0A5C6UZP1_9FLAO|nr:OsmC family protein [Luteibaculum oceani]TXC78379.1 OsmC family protein [Luteibaculum oceani]
MEIVKVSYDRNLSCDAIHLDSSAQIKTTAPKDNNGDGTSFSPTDLLCTSLATCCLTIMAIKARSGEINFENVEATVYKEMGSNPRWVQKVKIVFYVPEIWSGKERKIMENAAKTCPVFLSLNPEMEKELVFNYR